MADQSRKPEEGPRSGDAKATPRPSPWVTRGEVAVVLSLTAVLVVCVAVIVLRHRSAGNAIEIIRSQGEAAVYRINLNSATKGELVLLPGIGEKRAERIIQWRRTQGPLTSLDDVRKAAGLPKSRCEALRDLVTLAEQPAGGR